MNSFALWQGISAKISFSKGEEMDSIQKLIAKLDRFCKADVLSIYYKISKEYPNQLANFFLSFSNSIFIFKINQSFYWTNIQSIKNMSIFFLELLQNNDKLDSYILTHLIYVPIFLNTNLSVEFWAILFPSYIKYWGCMSITITVYISSHLFILWSQMF